MGDMLETPGAGPSRVRQHEEAERELFLKRRQEYQDLQHNIDSSTELLSSLASYLSTFQTDLSAVSGQVADLQLRSDAIESELQGRKDMLPQLNTLLSDLTLPPALVLTLRDTQPSQNPDLWLSAITQLSAKLSLCRALPSVHAASEMLSVLDGLRLRALHLLPPFLLSLIKPLRSASRGLSTNLAILQNSLLLKYQPFYAFLVRHAPRLAKQIERGYVNAARSYYETAFRRYTRALGLVRRPQAHPVNSPEAAADELAGLQYLQGEAQDEGVVLIFQAEDKEFTCAVEGIFRSMLLVLLDNASAEYAFIVRFFARPVAPAPASASVLGASGSTSVSVNGEDDVRSGQTTPTRATPTPAPTAIPTVSTEPNLADASRIWSEVFGTALESCDTLFTTLLTPVPPTIPLLVLIRLNDRALAIAQHRAALPLEAYLQKQRLALWPLFRKDVDARIDALRRLADDAEGKGFAGLVRGVKDAAVREAGAVYARLYGVGVVLNDEADEAMVFGSLTRMRAELVRLIQNQAGKIKSQADRQSFLSAIYDGVMRDLVSGVGPTTHPKVQSEMSFFRTREEEARRRP